MKYVFSLALAAALVVPYTARAQSKPNFSGTWTLDAARSDAPGGGMRGGPGGGAPGGAPAGVPGGAPGAPGGGAPGGGGGGRGGGPLTIAQTATDITIGANTYKLDGSEVEVQAGRGGTGKAKASWSGSTLVIETTRDMQGTAMTTKAVYGLSANGKDLTVSTTFPGMQGGEPRTTKRVYTKG